MSAAGLGLKRPIFLLPDTHFFHSNCLIFLLNIFCALYVFIRSALFVRLSWFFIFLKSDWMYLLSVQYCNWFAYCIGGACMGISWRSCLGITLTGWCVIIILFLFSFFICPTLASARTGWEGRMHAKRSPCEELTLEHSFDLVSRSWCYKIFCGQSGIFQTVWSNTLFGRLYLYSKWCPNLQ